MRPSSSTRPDLSRFGWSRRRWLSAAGSAALIALGGPQAALAAVAATPRQGRGPFYPPTLPLDRDNDLATVAGQDQGPAGTITIVAGHITGTDGAPVSGALVEIWQANGFGRYHHPGDRSSAPIDPGFQGYGQTVTDAAGGYRFRTIRPVPYPGRAPHIHYAVTRPGAGRTFVTQMYVAGEAGNQRDGLLNRLSGTARDRLIVALDPADGVEAGALAGAFDIVLPG